MEVQAEAVKNPTPASSQSSAEKKPLDSKQKVVADKNQQVVSEARESVLGTQRALLALENKDSKTALSILQTVSKNLDGVLSKNPALSLLIADVDINVFDYKGDEKSLKDSVKQADDLLDSGKLQGARAILANLASEMRITTISIPLGTYPAAIKKAIDQIGAGKPDLASQSLEEVLDSLVETSELLALPVLRAESLLTKASDDIAHKRRC
jgi:hypothetical protein